MVMIILVITIVMMIQINIIMVMMLFIVVMMEVLVMLTAMVEIMINKLIMVWLTMMIMIIMIKKIAMLILNINRVLVIEFAIAFGSSWSMFLVPKRTTTSLTDEGTDKSPVFHKVHWGLFLDMPQFSVLYGLKYFCHTVGYLFNPASMESQINTIDGYNQFANKS